MASSVKAEDGNGSMPATPARRRLPRPYLKSGLYARPQLPAPDTEIGKILVERRAGLVADLGGESGLTTTQRGLIDVALRTWSLLDSVDAFLFYLPSPVDKRHRKVWQVVLDRCRIASQLEATLVRLGLERKIENITELPEYLAAKDREKRAQRATISS